MSVTEIRPGVHVVDLGQNINGRVRLTELGPAGTEITLTHGEALGPDGDVTMTHLQPAMPFLPEPLSAGQVDSVVSAGVEGDTFEPRFTTHGFQFVRVEGHPGPLTADDVTGVVVHTDLEERGDFRCDVEVLERLHSAAVWSFRGNACDIPTDCPTSERAGWTGDWQLYVPTASYLYDVRGFSLKWLRDLAVEQWPDGNLGNMAPMPVAERTGFLEKMNGSAGWGDAIVLVPWEMYARVRRHRDARRAVAGDGAVARPGRADGVGGAAPGPRGQAPGAAAARAVPLGHRLPLGRVARARRRARRLPGVRRRRQVRRGDRVLLLDRGARGPDRDRSSARPRRRRATRCSAPVPLDAWRTEFVGPDGRITPHTQANLVRALTFGLVPDEHRQRAADDLADARPRGRHPPRHRVPVDARPAARSRRPRPPRPRLRAAAPGHRAVLAHDDRARGDHGLGALGRHPRRRLGARVAQPLLQGRRHLVPAPLRRRAAAARADLDPVPGAATPRRRRHRRPDRARVAARSDRRGLERRTAVCFTLDVVVPSGCVAEVVLPDGTASEVGAGRHRLQTLP